MDLSDRICNLECAKEANVHEFVGPVKIVLVDPPRGEYLRRRAAGAFITLANLLMGANTFCMILFCLGFKLPTYMNSHILLCTFGYQLFMPFGILMLQSLFSAAAPVKKNSRRKEHFCLQLIGASLYGSGTALAVVMGETYLFEPPKSYTSIHFYTGAVTAVLSAMCFLTGPCVHFSKCESKCSAFLVSVHRVLGISTFLFSSVCFVSGILKPIMSIWFFIIGYSTPTILVVCFCLFYTFVVIATPSYNLFIESQ